MTIDDTKSLPADSQTIKACCAAGYQSDLVGLILGDSYHPGGSALTHRLARLLDIRAGDEVLDVASGTGTTALLLASEYLAAVVGVDLGNVSVSTANTRAAQSGVAGSGPGRARFLVGDAERLPLPDASVDVVVSECAFCTFPDKSAAAAEIARVLRPGGRLGITDVVIETDRLDPELADLAGWVACLADARPVAGYQQILAAAGLTTVMVQGHDRALGDMIDLIDTRLTALSMAGPAALANIDLAGVHRRITVARQAVKERTAGYALIVATRS